jgi:hypothetical protein
MEKIYKEDVYDVTPDEAKVWILDYYNSTITTDYAGTNACDYVFESVYTADSYDVYWAHANDDYSFNPENVYYYATGMTDEIIGCIKDGLDIFIDEEIYDELYVDDMLHELYIEVQDKIENSTD